MGALEQEFLGRRPAKSAVTSATGTRRREFLYTTLRTRQKLITIALLRIGIAWPKLADSHATKLMIFLA